MRRSVARASALAAFAIGFPTAEARAVSAASPARAARLVQPASIPTAQARRLEAILERRLLLQETLAAAEPDVRERALAPLTALAERGVPTVFAPPSQALARSWHLAADARAGPGLGPDPPDEWQLAVDGLDLRVVPSAFESVHAEPSARGEWGEPMTVLFSPLRPVGPMAQGGPGASGGAWLSLHWIAPGGEETSARREPLDPHALRSDFEMYVRAPAGEPGRWWLVAEIEVDGRRARGLPLAVWGIADLRARLEALSPPERSRIEARLAAGEGSACLPLVEQLEGRECFWRPYAIEALGPEQERILAIEPAEGGARDTLVLLAPPSEPAEWSFAGAAGRAWEAFARSERMRVLATDLAAEATEPGGEPRGPLLGDLLSELETREPDARRLLVARGPALSRLAVAVRRGARIEVDGLVLCTYLGPGARPATFLPLPTLFVQVLASDEGASDESGLRWVRRRAPPLLVDPELPVLVADWLARSR